MMHGYPIRKIEVNNYNPKWDVYMFDQSSEIEETIEFYKYKKSKENIKNGIDNKRSGNNS